MRQPARRGRSPRPTGRGLWAESRGRAIYNLAISAFAVVAGFAIVAFPTQLGVPEEQRFWGGVLMGYGLVRGYYFYKRLRSISRG